MNDTATIILTSSVLAAIISTIVAYLTSLSLKKIDFKNEYYKEILKKRIQAYEHIEKQIGNLKAVVVGDDQKPYHVIFAQGDVKFLEFQKDLMLSITYNLWVDENTSNTLDNMNNLFFNLNNHVFNKSNNQVIEIGKLYYDKIAKLRIQLENDAKEGLYNLHDIKKAFKSKPKNNERIIYRE